MKTKITSLVRPVICIFLGLSLVFACQKINPFDGVELIINNDVYISPILVRAVNADASSKVLPSNAVATISGDGANFVVDDLGHKGNDIKMVNGVLTLNLLPEANPSPTKPIVFNVFVKCDGFVSSNQTIRVTDTKSTLKFYVPLVSVTAPPQGVTVSQQTATLIGGVTKSIIQLTSLGGNVTKSIVQVTAPNRKSETGCDNNVITIPAGTQIQDANGNVINASILNMQITFACLNYLNYLDRDIANKSALRAFPGGFIAYNATTIDGKKQPVTFEIAGFVAINMDAGGKTIKNFSTPIDVTISISKGLENPTNGFAIKEGDTVPIWSLDSEIGAWKEEGIATITKDASDNLVANFKAKHPSCWALAWYLVDPCNNATLTINVKSNLTKQQASYPYTVSIEGLLRDVDGRTANYFDYLNYQEVYDGASFTLERVPFFSKVRLTVMRSDSFDFTKAGWFRRKVVGSAIIDPCSGSTVVSINDTPPPPPSITLNVDVTAKCSNKNIDIKPSAWVLFDDILSGYDHVQEVYLDKGKLSLQIVEDYDYYMDVYNAGHSYTGRFKFSKTGSTVVPYGGGSGLTGTVTYDAASNTATLKAVYISDSCK